MQGPIRSRSQVSWSEAHSSQPYGPGWARVPLSSFSSNVHFFLYFLYFGPHFGPLLWCTKLYYHVQWRAETGEDFQNNIRIDELISDCLSWCLFVCLFFFRDLFACFIVYIIIFYPNFLAIISFKCAV